MSVDHIIRQAAVQLLEEGTIDAATHETFVQGAEKVKDPDFQVKFLRVRAYAQRQIDTDFLLDMLTGLLLTAHGYDDERVLRTLRQAQALRSGVKTRLLQR